jgi:hypothetical protein
MWARNFFCISGFFSEALSGAQQTAREPTVLATKPDKSFEASARMLQS